MRRRRGGLGPWGAAMGVAAIAAIVPFLGSWASAGGEREPAAEPGPASEREPLPPVRPQRDRPAVAPADRVALGVHLPGSTERPRRLGRYIRMTGHRPAIVSYYRRWQEQSAFDRRTLRLVDSHDAVPLITWEPWRQELREIAAGRYDRFVRATAREARRWGKPVLLRFAHEMNGHWYPWGAHANSRLAYVRAWRQVVRVFRRAGADNVRFVWTPNVDWGGRSLMRALYPGDRWVDWVGLSGFSWGGPWEWQSGTELFRTSYRAITSFSDKPFIIAEMAAGELGGDKAEWIEETFAKDLPRMRRVRAVVWFNGRQKWADWDVDSSRESLLAFRAAVASPRYSGTAEDVHQGGLIR